MARPPSETSPSNPRRPAGAGGVLLILLLALIVAGLALWGWKARPPSTPAPAATGNPPVIPPKDHPAAPAH
jgi:hypothetical protein